MKIRFTANALSDLDAILSYIDEQNPLGARNVKVRIKTVIDMLASYPKMGRMTDMPDVRHTVVTPYPYLVFYTVEADSVVILGVRHAARTRE